MARTLNEAMQKGDLKGRHWGTGFVVLGSELHRWTREGRGASQAKPTIPKGIGIGTPSHESERATSHVSSTIPNAPAPTVGRSTVTFHPSFGGVAAGGSLEKFRAEVDRREASGMSRPQAVAEVVRAMPDLQRSAIEESNLNRPRRRARA